MAWVQPRVVDETIESIQQWPFHEGLGQILAFISDESARRNGAGGHAGPGHVPGGDGACGEHFRRLRPDLIEAAAQGLHVRFDPNLPWDEVFRAEARDRPTGTATSRTPRCCSGPPVPRRRSSPGRGQQQT